MFEVLSLAHWAVIGSIASGDVCRRAPGPVFVVQSLSLTEPIFACEFEG